MTAARHKLSDSTTERGLAAVAALGVAQTAGTPTAMLGSDVTASASATAATAATESGTRGRPVDNQLVQGPIVEGDIIAGRYVIERHVSAGSFGFVYKASDLSIPHHAVALKLLRKPAGSESERQAALRELQLLASVSHPSVVQFKDYGWLDGRLWFSMPWYDGITLQERLAGESLTRKQARLIFERLAFGLAAMHGVGIHHHDIKPDNIFLAEVAGFEEGLPVLLDLGVAAKSGETPAGFTAEYVAPETAAAALGVECHPIGPAADVFALALTLRNCLEPETAPPSAGSPLPMLNQRANRGVEPPTRRELRYLAPSFRRWLSLNPADRPTAAEFARELAVLTAPEERRESRRRMIRRTAPLLLLLGGAVAALSYRVDQQKAQIDLQRIQLSAHKLETERLREESDQNLSQIESQLERMGKKDAQLRKAVAIARALDQRLDTAEREQHHAQRELGRTREAHAQLQAAHHSLTEERDILLAKQAALEVERTALAGRISELQTERSELQTAVETAVAEQGRALLERDALQERTLIAEQELQHLRGRASALESERRDLAAAQARASSTVARLMRERQQLAMREQVLRAQLMELDPEKAIALGPPLSQASDEAQLPTSTPVPASGVDAVVAPTSGPQSGPQVVPASMDPALMEPALIEPASIDPASIDPVLMEPASGEPAMEAPVTTEPVHEGTAGRVEEPSGMAPAVSPSHPDESPESAPASAERPASPSVRSGGSANSARVSTQASAPLVGTVTPQHG